MFRHNCKSKNKKKKKSQLNLLCTYPPKSYKRMHEDFVDRLIENIVCFEIQDFQQFKLMLNLTTRAKTHWYEILASVHIFFSYLLLSFIVTVYVHRPMCRWTITFTSVTRAKTAIPSSSSNSNQILQKLNSNFYLLIKF